MKAGEIIYYCFYIGLVLEIGLFTWGSIQGYYQSEMRDYELKVGDLK